MSTLSQFFLSPGPTVANLGVGNTPDLGGIIIRKELGVAWIVSPNQAEVSRTWTLRNDANTLANACTGCTGWFVPTLSQLQNPGFNAKEYWGGYSINSGYWSSTESAASYACLVVFADAYLGGDTSAFCCKTCALCVRAFRCVTY